MKVPLIVLAMVVAALIIGGCASPQERRGVSNIPINAPGPHDTRSIEGNL